MRREQRKSLTAIFCAALVLAAFVCPCLPGNATKTAAEHDCCAPAAAIRAAETGCCADRGGQTAVTASPVPPFSAPLPVEAFAGLPLQSTVPLPSSPLETATLAPFVLRI
jgi:hypothetical protein